MDGPQQILYPNRKNIHYIEFFSIYYIFMPPHSIFCVCVCVCVGGGGEGGIYCFHPTHVFVGVVVVGGEGGRGWVYTAFTLSIRLLNFYHSGGYLISTAY